ncbi:MAG: hypothetical protein HYU66_15370 [Armatimonadetes bacterium]|nr:hypothetical protein [Armatimonadota bacterium]
MRAYTVLLLALTIAPPGHPAAGATRLVSRKVVVPSANVSEAPEGKSDANWVVQSIVDGRWSAAPFYPSQAWMARRIGEPGFDIWCRLDLGAPRLIHRLRVQNSQLGSFVHPKDLAVEFSDGSRAMVTMARANDIQEFDFPPRQTATVTIHLLSHYGDGYSIDSNSGGFSEVELFEIVEEPATEARGKPFAVGRLGHVTTWLVLASRPVPWPAGRAPVDGEVLLDGARAATWGINAAPVSDPSFQAGALLYAAIENSGGKSSFMDVRGAKRRRPAGGGRLRLQTGLNHLLLEADGGPVTARCVGPDGKQAAGLRVLLCHERGQEWERQALAAACQPRLPQRIVKPGGPLDCALDARGVGYPVPPGGLRSRWQVLPGERPVVTAGLTGRVRAPAREGRYRLQCGLEGAGLAWTLPFVVHRHGPLPAGFTDLDGDGRPEVLRATWHGKDCIWISDDQRMSSKDVMGRFHGSYCVLVDVDGDGAHDGPDDFVYQAVDLDRDGSPDYEIYNASQVEKLVFSFQPNKPFEQDGHFKLSFLDWEHFGYADEQQYTGWANYRMGVHGNGCFHNTRRFWGDTRLAWENPIAWYDFNDDGWSDMVVRCADFTPPQGRLQEFETAFDIDRDSGPGRECSYNLQLTRTAYRQGALPYQQCRDVFRPLAGLAAANYLFIEDPDWRANQVKVWIPYRDAYRLGTDCDTWEACWLLFDEDFEDKRWEEMFDVHESWEPFADHLGDRWEVDADYSGRGQLYVGRFDGRLHLYGAERGDWSVDYHGLFHGSIDRRATAEGPLPPPGLPHDLVKYQDTDGNGFFDRIETCVATAPDWESPGKLPVTEILVRSVSLLDYATPADPHPDVCSLISTKSQDPLTGWKVSDWKGEPVRVRCDVYDRLTSLFAEVAERSWQEALALYGAADAAGLTRSRDLPDMPAGVGPDLSIEQRRSLKDVTVGRGYSTLLHPVHLRERYRNAYWLKEKVMADVLAARPERAPELRRLYCTGDLRGLVAAIAAGG